MVDKISPERRSENMRRIRSKDMKPEMEIRSLVHRLGYRYRLHRKELPGKPDLVFGPRKKVIFVHGCFWHGHDCKRSNNPKSNTEYWSQKIGRNIERDAANTKELKRQGWKVMGIWECESDDTKNLAKLVRKFLK